MRTLLSLLALTALSTAAYAAAPAATPLPAAPPTSAPIAKDAKPGPATPSSASAVSGQAEGPVTVVPEEIVPPASSGEAVTVAVQPASLTVTLGALNVDGQIPDKFAYCAPDADRHTKNGGNRNPQVTWSKGPEGTKSYALIVVDPDVPTSFDDADKAGKTIPDTLPRQNFYHWVLTDIPPTINSLPEGVDSSGVGKPKPVGKFAYGTRGVNDYGKFLGGPAHGGYDGPCPPWNDAKLHHYHFVVYALDTASVGLSGTFTGQDAETALKGHILAQGEAMGTYTQNPAVAAAAAAPSADADEDQE